MSARIASRRIEGSGTVSLTSAIGWLASLKNFCTVRDRSRPRLCENSNDQATVYNFGSVSSRFCSLQAQWSVKIYPGCAVFEQFLVFTQPGPIPAARSGPTATAGPSPFRSLADVNLSWVLPRAVGVVAANRPEPSCPKIHDRPHVPCRSWISAGRPSWLPPNLPATPSRARRTGPPSASPGGPGARF